MKKLLPCILYMALGAFSAVLRAQPIAIETLFQNPKFASMAVSPDGQYLAALTPFQGRQNLAVMDIGMKDVQPVSSMNSRDIVWFEWISSKRLIMRTGTLKDASSRGGGLYAVDRDGKYPRQLAAGVDEVDENRVLRIDYKGLDFVRDLPGDTDDIIVQEYTSGLDNRTVSSGLYRLNTRTGKRALISLGKPVDADEESWVVDAKGVARVHQAFVKGRVLIHYREGEDKPWRKLGDFKGTERQWSAMAIDESDQTLLATSQAGRDTAAIVRVDTATGKPGEVLAAHPRVDIYDLHMDQGVPVGVSYDDDKPGTAWFDQNIGRIQKAVDGALPGMHNTIQWSRARDKVLIRSYSDVSPAAFYLLDMKTGKINWLADSAPWIKPAQMSPMTPVRYAARDGLEIPAYLTLPKGGAGKKLPLVVYVHGGPWVSGDSWGFDQDVQFLASRGYAVLQPNYRGTTRYGWKHFSKSFKQWGLAMQDDIADGVEWAVKEGVADPKRVCIYGASYGGYAVMMGLVKTPELYRCGVNWLGVTDILTKLSISWSDHAYSGFMEFSAQDYIGDASRDREQLIATSPVEQAHKIKAPVLLAYATSDYRVPVVHGEKMKAALDKHGKPYKWLLFQDERHGFRDPKNIKQFYEEVEKFLAENLK
jgi:dipeptidyl aminopeptidase/acylaminoacyl peptidase